MTTQEALEQLGVHPNTITASERQQLDVNGYLVLPDILSEAQVEAMGSRLEELARLEGAEAGKELHQEEGTDRVANLINKDSIFDFCFTQPRVLAAVAHVLQGSVKLSSLNSRTALPGRGKQWLHMDGALPEPRGNFVVCNSIWLLDDFTSLNGPTRVVPGSHWFGKQPKEVLDDPMQPHPDEIKLLARRGTVVVFNSHLWHGGTLNETNQPRRTITAYYCKQEMDSIVDQRKWIIRPTFERLTPAARYILGVKEGDLPADQAAESERMVVRKL